MAERTTSTDCTFVVFPLVRRVGKVRDVARKMLETRSDRHADSYRAQVTVALGKQLQRIGIPADRQQRELASFWTAVHAEINRLMRSGRGTGGAA